MKKIRIPRDEDDKSLELYIDRKWQTFNIEFHAIDGNYDQDPEGEDIAIQIAPVSAAEIIDNDRDITTIMGYILGIRKFLKHIEELDIPHTEDMEYGQGDDENYGLIYIFENDIEWV